MTCPLAGTRWHMRRPIAEHRRRRRYRRVGGCAPPRLVALERPEITHWALGPVPDGWHPRRHWVLRRVEAGPRPRAEQLGLNFWGSGTPPTSPVEPPGRRGRARGPRADAARLGGNLGPHARGGT